MNTPRWDHRPRAPASRSTVRLSSWEYSIVLPIAFDSRKVLRLDYDGDVGLLRNDRRGLKMANRRTVPAAVMPA